MRVLIIEDDKILAKTVEQCIGAKYDVDHAYDGGEGVLYARQEIYDVIILDLMMPEMNGNEVLTKLRNNGIITPVLVLTAKDSIQDKVKSLQEGADDYLVKPFEREELIARLEALIRRNNGFFINNTVNFKNLQLNLKNRTAYIKGKEINLQGKQFDLLEYLINSKNTIITKEQIFDKIWGFDSETSTNVIEVYASSLRKELKKYGYDKYIKTLRGVGYILTD